ncbi:MAG: hypothetical protein ACRD3W_04930 [Terriglobales bacterium]
MSLEPSDWLGKAENFYHEHSTAVNLCLVGLAVAGAGAYGLRALSSGSAETVAEAGTAEFAALQNGERFMGNIAPRALNFKLIGDPEVFATPSKTIGASSWSATIPDVVDSTVPEQNALGRTTAITQKYGDITVRQTANAFEIEKPSYGSLTLNRASSTGRFFGPDGRLRMVLNPLGDEVRYGADGQVAAIGRNVHRTLDFMGIYSG